MASAALLGGGSLGCSALVSTDESKLGGGGPGVDGGPGDGGGDGGPGPDAGDGGPGPDSGPGDGGAVDMVPSNVSAALWDDGAPALDLSEERRYGLDTSTCEATMARSQVVAQAEGPELCVVQVRDLILGEGASLRVSGRRPLVLMASGRVRIEGTIDVSAVGIEPGPGGARGGTRMDPDGQGVGGGGAGEHVGSFDDGGGGGGGLCGPGGGGGNGGGAEGGVPGDTARTDWELMPLVGGSGGGRGPGADLFGGSSNAGRGGAGGGALQISARERIRLEGEVLAGGGGGFPGRNQASSSVNWGAGGGGGSGGAILIEAPEIDIGGDAFLNAAGGGGGGSASAPGDGDPGQDGRDTTDRALGGAGAGDGPGTGDLSASGGDGGGAATLPGDPGQTNPQDNANGGGGGGGSGCILLRTASGSLASRVEATPQVERGLRVLPVLRE